MTFSNEPFFKKFSSNLPTFPEMEEIDKVIKKSLCSNVSIFRDTTKYLYDLGGKRISLDINTIVQTSQSENTALGSTAGYSATHKSFHLSDKTIKQI